MKKSILGLVAGAGYRFDSRYAIELNAFNTRIETGSGSRNGFAAELAFSIQF